MNEVIKIIDITIICGHRDQVEQDKAFSEGKSKFKWPKSKHNSNPSKAVDVSLYPVDWNIDGFIKLNVIIMNTWYSLKSLGEVSTTLIWGGDWKMRDMPHYEIK